MKGFDTKFKLAKSEENENIYLYHSPHLRLNPCTSVEVKAIALTAHSASIPLAAGVSALMFGIVQCLVINKELSIGKFTGDVNVHVGTKTHKSV